MGRPGVGLGVLWRWSGGGLTLIAQGPYIQRLMKLSMWRCERQSAACIVGAARAGPRCGSRNHLWLRHLHSIFGCFMVSG